MVAAGKPLGGLLAGMMASAAMAGSTTNAVPRLAGVPLPGKPTKDADYYRLTQAEAHRQYEEIRIPAADLLK